MKKFNKNSLLGMIVSSFGENKKQNRKVAILSIVAIIAGFLIDYRGETDFSKIVLAFVRLSLTAYIVIQIVKPFKRQIDSKLEGVQLRVTSQAVKFIALVIIFKIISSALFAVKIIGTIANLSFIAYYGFYESYRSIKEI